MKILNSTLFSRKTAASLIAALALSGAGSLGAQTAVSNFNTSIGATATIGTYAGGGETWRRAFSFTTGATAANFNFASFTMTFNSASGSPGALSVGLYSAFDNSTVAGASGLVSNLSLSSGNPNSAGNSVFSGTATLAASTTYYLLLSSASAPAGNYYSYPVAASGSEDSGSLAGWLIGNNGHESNGANIWTTSSGPSQFSIQASAIPEPSTYAAIAGAAMLGLAVWQRRRKSAHASAVTAPVAI